jgi:putative radical SAM enzyme (TIGR03279 family)
MRRDLKYQGIKISNLPRTSVFYKTGLRKGDVIAAVNGREISDELEFRYLAASPDFRLLFTRNGLKRTAVVKRDAGSFLDIEFRQAEVRRCANQCVFCFIDQMPPGLRRSLYIKDEDLSHSFLNGNYVTLTNADRNGLERIVRLGLSPLYISVHATDPFVRRRMLGLRRAPSIMEQLSFLARNNIRLHTQIVVCPGYNDGKVLAMTVKDLFSLGNNLVSIAVVPVGLTKHRKFPLKPVDGSAAREICRTIGALSDGDRSKHGRRRLFLADEIFLRAGAPIPPLDYYEDYPQIENGVGLARQLLDKWNTAKRRPSGKGARRSWLLVTSVSAFPFLCRVAREAEGLRAGTTIHTEAVRNSFFGLQVTVAGLLTARDVIAAARAIKKKARYDRMILPGIMFNFAGFTLDGYSAGRIADEAGIKVMVVDSIEELLKL